VGIKLAVLNTGEEELHLSQCDQEEMDSLVGQDGEEPDEPDENTNLAIKRKKEDRRGFL